MKQKMNNQKQVERSYKKFRHNLTTAEAYLWNFLKGKKCEGRSFRRQHPIGKYILDFYCPSEKLAIELDGYYHTTYDGMERDEIRTAFLNSKGIKV